MTQVKINELSGKPKLATISEPVITLPRKTLLSSEDVDEENEGTDTFNHEWICIMAETKHVKEPKVGILKLKNDETGLNLGEQQANNIRLIFLVIGPQNQPTGMVSPIEIARTFGTLLKTRSFLKKLMLTENSEQFSSLLITEAGKRERYDRSHSRLTKANRKLHSMALKTNDNEGRDSKRKRHNSGNHGGPHFMKRKDSHISRMHSIYNPTEALSESSEDTSIDEAFNGHISHATYFKPTEIGQGIIQDIKNRLPHYASDWTDAFFITKDKKGAFKYRRKNAQKMFRTVSFVLMSILLPTLAFGNANSKNTKTRINVERTIFGQFIAGIAFSLLSSQPLGLLMTTPPITLLIKFVYKLSYKELHEDFFQFYAMTGVFIGVNLIMFSLTNMSTLLRKITPSVEEIFAIFTAYAFVNEVIQSLTDVTDTWDTDPDNGNACAANLTTLEIYSYRDRMFLWYLLAAGTFLLAFMMHAVFRNTPYFNQYIRHWIKDYSLLISVVLFSAVYNLRFDKTSFDPYVIEFHDIFSKDGDGDQYLEATVLAKDLSPKNVTTYYNNDSKCKKSEDISHYIRFEDITQLKGSSVAVAWAISIPLSILFFMDQGFCSIVTNAPKNKLQKPGGYHWDLFLVGLRI